jgi:hypothetical protein
MKVCMVENCGKKHHGKGLCKSHYTKFLIEEKIKDLVCSVPGCDKSVCATGYKQELCSMHITRLRRKGTLGDEKNDRSRKFFSLALAMKESENPLDFEIEKRGTWSILAKLYYGDKCSVCGWDEGTCDTHHKILYSKGGKNTLSNAVVLCPNHHRTHHNGKNKRFSDESLSSFKEIIDFIK